MSAAGEKCREFVDWSDVVGLNGIAGRALLQYTIYITAAILFASSAALLVRRWGPNAFHSVRVHVADRAQAVQGIPEIKAVLGGLILQSYLGPWTLLTKTLGLALAVASGLSLGKEGPCVRAGTDRADRAAWSMSPAASATSSPVGSRSRP